MREHETNLKDSFEFLEKIKNIDNLNKKTLVSFDAKSLLTNIPVQLKINIILDKLFETKYFTINGMNREQFKKLLTWTCQKTTLQYTGKYYEQTDGLAMGSPIAPAMADICMNWLIDKIFNEFKNSTDYFSLC